MLINAGFTISLLKVDPAKALLLISLNPLWAALQGKLLLGDPLPRRTVVAQLLSLLSTVVVFMLDLLNATQGINAIDRLVLAHGLLKCSRVIIREWSLRAEPAAHAVCSRRRLVCVT